MTGAVILVRHGATAWSGQRYAGRSDPWLSPEGRAQVQALATDVARTVSRPLHIVTSPSRRARQTARAIARSTGASLSIDSRWMEADFGIAEGWTFAELERLAPDIAASIVDGEVAIDWPGGESAAALLTRVAAALADARAFAESTASTVVVVAHAGPIRSATALAEGRESRSVALLATAACTRLRWEPASSVLPSDS
ncbi:MAG: histidine phosphatase family protein [Candidatus Limnocylindrales bacterium]